MSDSYTTVGRAPGPRVLPEDAGPQWKLEEWRLFGKAEEKEKLQIQQQCCEHQPIVWNKWNMFN